VLNFIAIDLQLYKLLNNTQVSFFETQCIHSIVLSAPIDALLIICNDCRLMHTLKATLKTSVVP